MADKPTAPDAQKREMRQLYGSGTLVDMLLPCEKCGYFCWVKSVETNSGYCKVCDLAQMLCDEETLHAEAKEEIGKLKERLANCRKACEAGLRQSNKIAELVGYKEGELSAAVVAWGEKRFQDELDMGPLMPCGHHEVERHEDDSGEFCGGCEPSRLPPVSEECVQEALARLKRIRERKRESAPTPPPQPNS